GADSTITLPYALRLMGSWWPNGTVFPPLPAPVILDSLPPGRRRTSARGDHRVRPERHNPNSIATLRMILARQLLGQLPQCPFLWNALGMILRINIGFGHAESRLRMTRRCAPGPFH